MIRNLKTLGLALVAVLVLSAVAASTASAQLGKVTSTGSVTLEGTETGAAGANSLTAFDNTIECPGSHYTGHKVATTPHALIPSGATEVTVTPIYTNCPKAIAVNGCDFVFSDATTTGGVAGTYGFKAAIVCPAGKSIVISGPFGCNTSIGSQTGLTGPVHITNTPANAPTPTDFIDIVGTIENIKATNVCLGETKTAILHIDALIKGYNGAKVETGVTISD